MISPLTTWQVAALTRVMFVARRVHTKINLNQKELRRGQNICIIPMCSLFNKDPSAHKLLYVQPCTSTVQSCDTIPKMLYLPSLVSHQTVPSNPCHISRFFSLMIMFDLCTSQLTIRKGLGTKVGYQARFQTTRTTKCRSLVVGSDPSFFTNRFSWRWCFPFEGKDWKMKRCNLKNLYILFWFDPFFSSKSLVFFDVLCGSFEKNGLPNAQGLTSASPALVCSAKPVQPWQCTKAKGGSCGMKWLRSLMKCCQLDQPLNE